TDAQRMASVATLDLDLTPSCRLSETHDLAFVVRATRAPGTAEVQRLQQVRLARAVAPVDDRQPGAEGDVRALVRAEVPHPEAPNDHAYMPRGPASGSHVAAIGT